MKSKLLISFIVAMFTFSGFAQIGPGEIDTSFNEFGTGAYGGTSTPDAAENGNVYDTKVYGLLSPNGNGDKVVIAGRFTFYNGVARKKVARLNADGTLDTSFVPPNISGYIYAIAITADDKILIAGEFSISGVAVAAPLTGTTTYKNIARLNNDGTVDNTFIAIAGATRGTNLLVHAIALASPTSPATKIWIGGSFTSFTGTACGRVLKLNANGTIDSSIFQSSIDNSVTGEVRSLAPYGSNGVLVGGLFDGYKSLGVAYTRYSFIHQNADGSITPNAGFNAGTGATGGGNRGIYMIQYKSSRVYLSGRFDRYNDSPTTGAGQKRGFIKLVGDPADGNVPITVAGVTTTYYDGDYDPTFTTIGVAEHVFCFVIQGDNKIIVGGSFDHWFVGTVNTVIPKGIARLKSNGQLDSVEFLTGTGFSGGTDVFIEPSTIRRITLQSDAKILVGGDYTHYNGTARRMICRIKTRECLRATVYEDGVWSNQSYLNTGAVEPAAGWPYFAVVSGTCTLPNNSHYYACELDIQPDATIIIPSSSSITVKGVLMNNGTFTVKDDGNFVQINDLAVNADYGEGIFNVERKTAAVRRFDFTYWSSPVDNQTLSNLTPLTLSDKFFKWNASTNNWVNIPGSEIMVTGKGYIARAPQNHDPVTPSIDDATFTGRPHNGVFTIPVVKVPLNDWNLLGNPYPSAIDATLFLQNAANANNIKPILHFWTHASAVNYQGQFTYQGSDYLTWTVAGPNAAPPLGITPFDGKIASGQGFFVESKNASGNVIFNNAMRQNTGNAQFYRTAGQPTKSRYWLKVSNEAGISNQTLVAYISDATNELDEQYDAPISSVNAINLYSINTEEKLTIQARASFVAEDEVAIGYTADAEGTFEISLQRFDGLFAGQDVYLKDLKNNTVHNLTGSAYSFKTLAGTFDQRFVIVYKDQEITAPEVLAGNSLEVSTNTAINLLAEGQLIKSVAIFDVTGKKLYESNGVIDQDMFTVSTLAKQNQLLVVKVKLSDDTTQAKKILY